MLIKICDYYIEDTEINRITPVYIANDNTTVFFHIYFKNSGAYERAQYDIKNYQQYDINTLKQKVKEMRDNLAKSLQPHSKITDYDLILNNDGK